MSTGRGTLFFEPPQCRIKLIKHTVKGLSAACKSGLIVQLCVPALSLGQSPQLELSKSTRDAPSALRHSNAALGGADAETPHHPVSSRGSCARPHTFPFDSTENKRASYWPKRLFLSTSAKIYTRSPAFRRIHPRTHPKRRLALSVPPIQQDGEPRPVLPAGGLSAG